MHDGVRAEDGGPILHRVVARHAPAGAPATSGAPTGKAALIGRARLLVIDELGFPPLDPDGARPLFQVFADPYERQSVAITTNLEISRWGAVFGDDQMAAAVIDTDRPPTEGSSSSRGESYRVRNALVQEG